MISVPSLPCSFTKYLLLLIFCMGIPAQGNITCVELLRSADNAVSERTLDNQRHERISRSPKEMEADTRLLHASRHANSNQKWLQKIFDRLAKIFPKWTSGIKSGLEKKALLSLLPNAKELLQDAQRKKGDQESRTAGFVGRFENKTDWAPDLVVTEINGTNTIQLKAKKGQHLSSFQAEQIIGLAEFITNFLIRDSGVSSGLSDSQVTLSFDGKNWGGRWPRSTSAEETATLLIKQGSENAPGKSLEVAKIFVGVLKDLLNMDQRIFEAINGGARGLIKTQDLRLGGEMGREFHLLPRLNKYIQWYTKVGEGQSPWLLGFGRFNFGLNIRRTDQESEIEIRISSSSVILNITGSVHLLTDAAHTGSTSGTPGQSPEYFRFLKQIDGAYTVNYYRGGWGPSPENHAVYVDTPSRLTVEITPTNKLLESGGSFQDIALNAIQRLFTDQP